MIISPFATKAVCVAALLTGGSLFPSSNGAVSRADAFQILQLPSTAKTYAVRGNALLNRPPTSLDVLASPDETSTETASSPVGGSLGLEYPPISPFGRGASEGQSHGHANAAEAKRLLGGKGANLAEMSAIGLSVPPGFTISTESCSKFCSETDWNFELPAELWDMIVDALKPVEDAMGTRFGDASNPLLLSVRSGAAISMPGMMDTGAQLVIYRFVFNVIIQSAEK